MSESESDSAKIDAWLAGELPPEEAEALERQFAEIASTEAEDKPDASLPDPTLLLDLDRDHTPTTSPGSALTDLVDRIKTLSGDDLPSPAQDSWREILTPSEDPKYIGTLGDYEIIEAIATGGMATVLKARDPKLDRTIALKILPPELAANQTARARFLREARAAAKLEHDNILPIHAVHEDDHAAFFAMRYVPTGSLQDALDRGEEFDIDKLKSIARGVAAALDAAHSAGIIHRDIKPANILLGENEGEVWVCDFGIARSTEDPSLTYTNSIAGTPQYMSPEQAAGNELDGRSDLFSLGTVLYRCATGEQAFGGTTTASVISSLATIEPKAVETLNPKLPKWFGNLLSNLLAKKTHDRAANAAAVVRAIDDEHSPRPKARQRRRRRFLVAAAGLLLITLLLQLPVVRQLGSRAIGKVTGRTFLVDSRLGAYSTLQQAISAARDGDTITLPQGKEIFVDGISIPPGKSLTIRSDPDGERPTLITKIPGATGISTRSPLRLENLDFRIEPINEGSGIVQLIATDGHIENCRFTSGPRTQQRGRFQTPNVIEIQDGGELEIATSEFDLGAAIAVAFFGTLGPQTEDPPLSSLTLRDTRVAASLLAYSRDWSGGHRQRIEIRTERLQFNGGRFFKHNPYSPIPEIDFHLDDCELALSRSFAWFQTNEVSTVVTRLKLHSKATTFPASNFYLKIGAIGNQARAMIQINHFDPTNGMYIGDKAPRGRVVIKETGESFANLARAAAAAQPGATLQLSGRLEANRLMIRPTVPINLEAAPGERPVVSASNPTEHGLYLSGPCSVRGIRFESEYGARGTWLPIIGINGRNHEVLVEDCQFVSRLNERGDTGGHSGLGISDSPRAIVRRCNFHIEDSAAFLPGTRADNILISECSFVAQSLFDRRNITFPAGHDTIRLERCAVLSDHFLIHPSTTRRLDPISFQVEDCLLDVRTSLFELSAIAAADLPDLLSWKGTNNIHRQGATALRTLQGRAGADFVPTEAKDFAALAELGVKIENNNIKFGAPFDRSHLREPVTPKALLDSLDTDIESPAIATLEQFKNAPEPAKTPQSGFDWQKLNIFKKSK